MRILLALLLLVTAARADENRTIRVGNTNRTFILHKPANLPNPAPLVIAFHGLGMNGQTMLWYTGLNAKADKSGFIVAYPDGLGQRFNDATDVPFAKAIVANVQPDPKRVYAAGMSNGGFFCYTLAAQAPELVAAIAPVSGNMQTRPKGTTPVAVIHFHGTSDWIVGYNGATPSVVAWAKVNGYTSAPVVTKLPDISRDNTTVSSSTYGPNVVLYTINGGGHTWPGQRTSPWYLGTTSFDINANDLIWDFFKAHPRP